MDKNKILKPLLLIVGIIILCSVLSRVFSNSETLAEYAEKHPEIAYSSNKGDADKNKASKNTQSDSIQVEGKQTTEKQASEKLATEEQTTNEQASLTRTASMDTNSTNTDTTDSDTTNVNTTSSGTTNVNATDSGTTDVNATNIDATDVNTTDVNTTDAANTSQESEDSTMNTHLDRVVYKNGFYYEPLSEDLKKRITGISYPVTEAEKDTTVVKAVNVVSSTEDIAINYDELCYVSVLHYNFKGIERTGELICNKAIAQDLVEIFYELYQNEYQIEQIRLIDEYSGDDTLSMQDNNTSCFNYRVVDGTSSLSKHALGLAIDINPFFNPYVVYKNDGTTYISPQGSETYVDRSKDFAYKIDENDLCYKLFKEHGFVWGGDWNSCKDYQHFQKVPE